MYETYETIVQSLRVSGIPFTIHEHAPSYTVADAEAYLDFPLDRLLKTIAFRIRSGDYILGLYEGPIVLITATHVWADGYDFKIAL